MQQVVAIEFKSNWNYLEGVEGRRRGRQRRLAFSVWVLACGRTRPLWASGCRPRPAGICPSPWDGRRHHHHHHRRHRNTRHRWSASGRFSRPTSAASRRAVSSAPAAPGAPATMPTSCWPPSSWNLHNQKTKWTGMNWLIKGSDENIPPTHPTATRKSGDVIHRPESDGSDPDFQLESDGVESGAEWRAYRGRRRKRRSW